MATLFKKQIKTSSKIDQIKKSVKILCISNGLKISDTESIILTHFILEGFNKVSKEEILTQKLIKNKQQLENIISGLRRRGLIVKSGYKEDLADDFKGLRGSQDKLALMILLDNSGK